MHLVASVRPSVCMFVFCLNFSHESVGGRTDGQTDGRTLPILLLRSAVGMTHSLRSDLWWTIPFRVLLGHFGIPIGSLTIKSALARHTGVRRVFGSRHGDHVINLPINIGTYHIQPHGCTWVVLWLFCFRSTPLRSLILGPLSRVHFGESLVVRLYSEIDHTYLSIEAQCVSHHYPRWTATVYIHHLSESPFDLSEKLGICTDVRHRYPDELLIAIGG